MFLRFKILLELILLACQLVRSQGSLSKTRKGDECFLVLSFRSCFVVCRTVGWGVVHMGKKDITKSMNLNGTIEMVGRQEIKSQHGPSRPAQ